MYVSRLILLKTLMAISCRFLGFTSRNARNVFTNAFKTNIFTERTKPELEKCFKRILNVLSRRIAIKTHNKTVKVAGAGV